MVTKRFILLGLFFIGMIVLHAQPGFTIRSGGAVTVNGNTTIIPCSLPAPVAGTHLCTATQITWNWNAVSGATGYKWNTVNDYTTAIDLGTATTKTESGLLCNTGYTRFVWAYTPCGNSGSLTMNQSTSVCPFNCGQLLTDSRDGKSYATVQIGTQCWMRQNLNIGTRIAGSSDQADNGIIEKYCFNNLESNCTIYGGLYQWAEAMQYSTTEGVQGICPTGWHLPTDGEWTTLTNFLGGLSVAGGKMKEAGTAHWASPNTGATNSSGFTALPGAYRDNEGNFANLTIVGLFWSSTPADSPWAWSRDLANLYENVMQNHNHIAFGESGRCIKD